MEHLVTLHHVRMWLEDKREKVPESETELIGKCKEIQQRMRKVDYKVINCDSLHFKCKKARIRFTKEAADELYTRQIFGENPSVLKQNQSEPVENSEDLKKLKKKGMHRNRKLKKPKKKNLNTVNENSMDVGDFADDTSAQASSLSQCAVDSTVLVREPSETSNIIEDVFPGESVSDVVDTVDISDGGFDKVNPENPMNSIKAEVVDEMKDAEMKADIESLSIKSKLSLSEYKNLQQEKEKKREMEEARLETEREATEIVVLGQKRPVATTSRQRRQSEKEVKKEEPLDDQLDQVTVAANQLLAVPEENTGGQVADTSSDLNPEIVYKKKVKEAVNDLLMNYYDDGSDASNKTIKISDSEQFVNLCKDFSRQIREEIKETYLSINGSVEGIEKVNVMEFGIDNIIQKHFENLPVLN